MLYDTHRQHRRDPPAQEHTSLPPRHKSLRRHRDHGLKRHRRFARDVRAETQRHHVETRLYAKDRTQGKTLQGNARRQNHLQTSPLGHAGTHRGGLPEADDERARPALARAGRRARRGRGLHRRTSLEVIPAEFWLPSPLLKPHEQAVNLGFSVLHITNIVKLNYQVQKSC